MSAYRLAWRRAVVNPSVGRHTEIPYRDSMTTGPTDARPLQVRIADDIRAKIETGEYAPGQQLPTFDDLAATYLCSLAVIRKSADLLKQQGLLIRSEEHTSELQSL